MRMRWRYRLGLAQTLETRTRNWDLNLCGLGLAQLGGLCLDMKGKDTAQESGFVPWRVEGVRKWV